MNCSGCAVIIPGAMFSVNVKYNKKFWEEIIAYFL
jgi:hypothetical protein